MRPTVNKYFDKPSFLFKLTSFDEFLDYDDKFFFIEEPFASKNPTDDITFIGLTSVSLNPDPDSRSASSDLFVDSFKVALDVKHPFLFLQDFFSQNNYLTASLFGVNMMKNKSKRVLITKCRNSLLTMSG